MKNKLLLSLLLIHFSLYSQDFNPGPYGVQYFDIAGPFTISDLNSTLAGDLNGDEIVNIQDVILEVAYIMGNLNNIDWFDEGDMNNDDTIDILDVIMIVNNILTPSDPDWSFENNWNGEDSYIFISYSTATGSSTLWNASDREDFLEKSPENVHYFFVSDRPTFVTDINNIKAIYDDILAEMEPEDANHWRNHLHFVPTKVSGFDNWLTDALQGRRAIGIDRFQRIREVGYLGNPNGFTGTYVSYIAHEAVYYNSEWDNLVEDETTYDEVTVWEREFYSGWWGATISTNVIFPSEEELSNYSGMAVELLRGCPDCGLFDGGATEIECGETINYSDAGCDDYDRIARMYICDENGENCNEAARWITPFARQPHHLTDISPLISLLKPGGNKTIKLQESGWPNSLITLRFRFYHNTDNSITPQEFIPIWNGTVQFNPDYADNRPPTPFVIPENAEKVEFVSLITGHGWGNNTCYNCCEFCNSRHIFEVNGGTTEFSIDFPDAGSNTHCMSLEMIGEGTVPNQYGTWGYGRAGWCPGLDVDPFITDITNAIAIGDENIIDYNACRVSGTACLTPPTCGTCGYCPEVAFSSYIIIYY
tara:strand:- start:1216 stop:2994 length:1779 start_codon:yes stop_codon:yes gene_type:complete